jgi:RNA-dependent RNA polymerase
MAPIGVEKEHSNLRDPKEQLTGSLPGPRVASQRPDSAHSPRKVTREPTKYRQAPFLVPRRRLNVASPSDHRPQASPAVPGGPILKSRESWQSWSELTVKIFNLPPSTTTWNLWKRFETQGTIVFIELFETRQGTREGTAKIRFSPPPHRDFWGSGSITMQTPDGQGEIRIRIDLEPKKRSFELRSPIRNNVWYPETMSSYPSAITFGFMYEETVMMNMRHVLDEWRNIKFNVDLLRSRLVVNFQTTLMGPLANPLQAAEAEPRAESLDRTKKYMFSIPFGQLQKIYRVELDETRWGLLLSLDCPPQFFQKRGDARASHSSEALTWSDIDTWYRLTDIVYNPNVLENTAVALKKELPFIDIGNMTQVILNKPTNGYRSLDNLLYLIRQSPR